MNRFVKAIIWANMAVIAALAFAYPHLVISPGKLLVGHHNLETDCFACHTPLIGAQSNKCITCHAVKDIGILTSKGLALPPRVDKTPVPFHQHLIEQECIACHSDHTGIAMFRPRQHFSHTLLEPATRDQCVSCHKKPGDRIHEKASDKCAQCHTQEKWKPATFKHELLAPAELQQCFSCHKKPVDKIHEKASEKCGQCHKTDKWKPAFFKHELLNPTELRQCATCHAKQMPNDQRHRESSGRCGNCHYTTKWEPAKKTFGSSSGGTTSNWIFQGGGDDD